MTNKNKPKGSDPLVVGTKDLLMPSKNVTHNVTNTGDTRNVTSTREPKSVGPSKVTGSTPTGHTK